MADATIDQKLADLQADYQLLRKDLSEMTKVLKDTAKVQASTTTRRAGAAAEAASARLKDSATEALDLVEKEVQQHPWAVIGAAFGVGLLVGRLLGR